MKILFDENVPKRLKNYLPGYEVLTVQEMGWGSIKNGALLKKADAVFDVFITVDKNMQRQQNLAGITMCVVTLMSKSSKLDFLIPLVPELLRHLSLLQLGSGTAINVLPP
jgi:predicted nuclease of predicted toxin-antitoxin system